MTHREFLPADVEAALREAIEHALATRPPEKQRRSNPLAARAPTSELPLVERLTNSLYASWYTSWSGPSEPRRSRPAADSATRGRQLVEALRAAHADSRRFEDGWTALRVWRTGRILAAKADARRVLDPIDYVSADRPGLPARHGAAVRAVARRDSVTAQPGYWFAFATRWERVSSRTERIRLYWNVGPAAAPALVWEATSRLAIAAVPYALKLPTDVHGYERTDAAVIFLPRGAFRRAVPELRRIHAALATSLGDATPPLARRLALGLGLAEDPFPDESFGSNRCRLIAEALAPELARGNVNREALLDAVCRRLDLAGLELARPHLNAPGKRDYEW